MKPTKATLLSATVWLHASVGCAHAQAQEPRQDQTISERVTHHRAIDALVWAMPLLNFKKFRDGHKALGVGYNDIAYHNSTNAVTGPLR